MTITVSADPPDATELQQLLDGVEAVDGGPPLSDAALAAGTDGARTAFRDRQFAGYARVTDGALEIAADGADTVDALLDAFPDASAVWSHGARSRLVGPLQGRGFRRARDLLRMSRPLDTLPPDDPPLPDGVTVRAFVPGRDDTAWLAVNAAAFADHPEQGRWTADDLRARVAEPWFDAAGFLLAERDGELRGFHWTKLHPHGVGEVYVLGIAPAAQGTGLGRGLLTRGLRTLAEHGGATTAMLYVDGDNPGAVRLYERDGFARTDVDVQWRR